MLCRTWGAQAPAGHRGPLAPRGRHRRKRMLAVGRGANKRGAPRLRRLGRRIRPPRRMAVLKRSSDEPCIAPRTGSPGKSVSSSCSAEQQAAPAGPSAAILASRTDPTAPTIYTDYLDPIDRYRCCCCIGAHARARPTARVWAPWGGRWSLPGRARGMAALHARTRVMREHVSCENTCPVSALAATDAPFLACTNGYTGWRA
jgi:hypothetical protein